MGQKHCHVTHKHWKQELNEQRSSFIEFCQLFLVFSLQFTVIKLCWFISPGSLFIPPQIRLQREIWGALHQNICCYFAQDLSHHNVMRAYLINIFDTRFMKSIRAAIERFLRSLPNNKHFSISSDNVFIKANKVLDTFEKDLRKMG